MNDRLLFTSPKLFTPEMANKTLPLVTAIVRELEPSWKAVLGSRRRVEHLLDNRESDVTDPYSDELNAMQVKLQQDSIRVESLVDELRDIGLEFKGSSESCHVCFPSMLDGRLVYLSWQLGENEVNHWIELDGQFDDRLPLLVAAATE